MSKNEFISQEITQDNKATSWYIHIQFLVYLYTI